ncbi:MAG: hypothetical protein GY860_21700 [Desulfobacteraceae bacterium]|nr:hypothetical protein [Desulfobacteraceae bacterium]
MKKKLAAILVTLCLFWGPLSADEIIIPRNRVASAFLGKETPFVSSREDGIGNNLENLTSAHGPEAMSENILEE